MSFDYEKMSKEFAEWAKSDESKAYLLEYKRKNDLLEKRYIQFEEWLKNNDFNILIQRLILEHDKNYRDKCYNKGYEPYSNNKLGFVINYIKDNLEPIKVPELESIFRNQIWFFKGYYFQMIWGQGVLINIFNDDFKYLLQV